VLDSIDENSTVIVCSDHGFRGPLRTKEGLKLGISMHRELGVLAAMGPGIRRGGTLASANVLDLTPTILALLGEPVGRDMDGFVLTNLIDEGHLADYPVTHIDTYERDDEPEQSEEPIESALDDAIREELRSLGYIE
jgi:arylsulfatase A-like enzyme